ncbi:transporter associated domain-containing protein [Vannielia litorea]|uniref:Magnesium and cobalt transporter n=1 Tax=Vannielia litorea TaxID=1217970 RepID=A0A1N6GLN3_9RHOB|nr:transporter associated domain-containing protein [Vannielia litorea]SIO08445.1 magnesium and cobalt transporter [Vannielia litorea]
MGESSDGSSSAAQGALETDSSEGKGLWGRLAEAIFPADESDAEDGAEPRRGGGREAVAMLGLGNLHRMRVEDVAIPKVEIVAVPLDIGKEDLVAVFRDSGMSRLPVYEGTLDSPVGMVHLKDFALKYGFNGHGEDFDLKPMLRPLLYAPPSMPIGVLLQKMQSERMHMALVIDEYGGTDGLATIEDLIEQVIGEIEDEHDIEEGDLWTEEKPGQYLAMARTPLEDFEEETGVALADAEDLEEVDTLGGLVFMLTGRVPTRGEVVPHPGGAEFEVLDADPRRVKRLRVRLPEYSLRQGAGADED